MGKGQPVCTGKKGQPMGVHEGPFSKLWFGAILCSKGASCPPPGAPLPDSGEGWRTGHLLHPLLSASTSLGRWDSEPYTQGGCCCCCLQGKRLEQPPLPFCPGFPPVGGGSGADTWASAVPFGWPSDMHSVVQARDALALAQDCFFRSSALVVQEEAILSLTTPRRGTWRRPFCVLRSFISTAAATHQHHMRQQQRHV